jgi:hypothetical protein
MFFLGLLVSWAALGMALYPVSGAGQSFSTCKPLWWLTIAYGTRIPSGGST